MHAALAGIGPQTGGAAPRGPERGARVRRIVRAERVTALAVTAPGLAPYAARELHARGITPVRIGAEGVEFQASLHGVYAANLWLRTASRVLVRLASFHADSFHELERRARRVAWDRFLPSGRTTRLRVTCRKSRLYHSDAVAERIAGALARCGAAVSPPASADRAEPDIDSDGSSDGAEAQLVVVRLLHDRCTVSLDSSGALLHRRGYRLETAKAPLRETLAAAVLMASGWSGQSPLVDPMCGAGTLAIEGAWLARGRAPGRSRTFAFMTWVQFDHEAWGEQLAAARSAERAAAGAAIVASDRDVGAVTATRDNAERADVARDIEILQRPLAAFEAPPGPGWLVANPPYGVRIGTRAQARASYAELGRVARRACAGWTVAVMAPERGLARHLGLPLVTTLRTVNGGIPVELLTGVVPATRRAASRR